MARKGESKSEKRLAASRAVPLMRKENTWTIKAACGPHSKRKSIAAGFVLRDLLKAARTMKESKRILEKGAVEVDGRRVRDPHFSVGLFDLFTVVPEKKTFRILVDSKGRLYAREEKSEKNKKLCKVVAKNTANKGKTEMHTNDGRSFQAGKSAAKKGDTLLVEVPSQKVLEQFSMEPGKSVLVVDGRNVGTLATVKAVVEGTMRRPKLVSLEASGREFQTAERNVFVVGDKKPAIEVTGD